MHHSNSLWLTGQTFYKNELKNERRIFRIKRRRDKYYLSPPCRLQANRTAARVRRVEERVV